MAKTDRKECENTQTGGGTTRAEFCFLGGERRIKKYLTIRSAAYLCRHRTPNNVQLKWASERKKMVRAFRKGCDNIETEEGEASYKVVVDKE